MFNLMLKIKQFFGLTYYTSKLDRFLSDFDQAHPKLSASQRAEKEKYDRIYKLRDQKAAPRRQAQSLWEKF